MAVVLVCVLILVTSSVDAAAQSRPRQASTTQQFLKLPAPRSLDAVRFLEAGPAAKSWSGAEQQAPTRRCRRGRRALIGALIGAGAAVPLAMLAHRRWENEAKDGTAVATTTIVFGAGLGAFIGVASCN